MTHSRDTRRPMRMAKTALLATLLAATAAEAAGAQAAAAQQVDSGLLDLLEWRSIGPTRGGRVLGVAGHPTDDLVFYQGTAGGGVWKTGDGGANWRNVSDGYFGAGSVGAVEVSPSHPDIVYVGMGETCFRGNASHGDGVYRSDDGGVSWRHLGLAETLQIARVRIHPENPDIAWVAALGDAWGASEARGVYRTRDGGANWEKVLYRDEDTGAIDLVLDPANPDILYASFLELRRFPWGFRSAGPGTGLFKSTDGGDTWTELTDNPGLPSGLKGKIGITVSPRNSGRLWAIVDAARGAKGIFRSDDAGETWTRVNEDANLLQRPWYYHHIVADPGDENTVFVPQRLPLEVDGRRRDLRAGVHAAPGSPRPVDRSRESPADGQRERRRRRGELRRRPLVVESSQSGDGADVPRDRRPSDAVPALRFPAGQHVDLPSPSARTSAASRSRTGTRWAAGRTGTSR